MMKILTAAWAVMAPFTAFMWSERLSLIVGWRLGPFIAFSTIFLLATAWAVIYAYCENRRDTLTLFGVICLFEGLLCLAFNLYYEKDFLSFITAFLESALFMYLMIFFIDATFSMDKIEPA